MEQIYIFRFQKNLNNHFFYTIKMFDTEQNHKILFSDSISFLFNLKVSPLIGSSDSSYVTFDIYISFSS